MTLLFFILTSLSNRISGGALDHLLKIEGNFLIRVFGALLVSIATLLILPFNFYNIVIALFIGVAWFIFRLFTWGPWHDMGTLPNEVNSNRKYNPEFMKSLYFYFLFKTPLSPKQIDSVMMFIRGLFNVTFLPIFLLFNTLPYVIILLIVTAFFWSFAYYIGRNYLDKFSHHSTELLSGLVIGIMIYFGIM